MKKHTLTMIVSALLSTVLAACAIEYPGATPGPAAGAKENQTYVLNNKLIRAEWNVDNGRLSAPTVKNLASGETLQAGGDLFGISLTKQQVDEDWVYLGVRLKDGAVEAQASMDGKSWSTLAKLPAIAGAPKLLRVGKTDNKGGDRDHGSAGEMGTSEFLEVREHNKSGKVLTLTGKPARIHKSTRAGTELAINNEHGTIQATANSTAFSEYKVDGKSVFFSCRIKKGSDKGMTWGPGLTLVFDNGEFVVVGVRAKGTYNVLNKGGEQIIKSQVTSGLNCDLFSGEFTCGAIQTGKTADGLMLKARLTHPKTGLNVLWQAELRNDANYVRQELTFSGKKELDVHGLQLLDFKTKTARQHGQVPGSPVITDSFFTGIEIPVTVNYVEDDGFRSGFGCYLPVDPAAQYRFSTVVGVYPEGQVRRAFNYYLERERAMPSKPFLHYNCWYDFFPPEDGKFLNVIKTYNQELTEKRGVALDSFVMDDGWDNYNEGLWAFHRQRFPNGFDNVAREAQKIGSNLGVWISPLGGYGGANQRTQHARSMGLIEDQLDLSQPGYYKWYRDKCLGMMRDYNVNYFKWEKAGSGVDPHFMALLRIAEELKKEDPNLYLNVTVGTWPSPFWLNHIDCTWRSGSGDVNWHGPGDKRESWLTYRDMYCYRLCVQRAPLYPINSLMHHGLVLGYEYQGKTVAEAGADMKNAARSYFAAGPNLQELYLSSDLMTSEAWDHVAEAIKWNKKNQDILVDAHWVGGDPGKLEVYGWAAWLGDRATLALRNPNDKEQTISIDVAEAFELPKGAAKNWQLKNAYADQAYDAPNLQAGKSHTFTLKPFEVLVFDAAAVKK